MAKAVHFFTGRDSYGRPQDYAQRADGAWFYREYRFNGYGMGWSRWTMLSGRIRESLDNCLSKMVGETLDYGFNPLRRIEGAPVRLPNN